MSFPRGSDCKESACNAGHLSSVLGSGRSPGGGHGNPLQDSCLESPMDRGARWATVHGVTKGQTQLSDFTFTFIFQRNDKQNTNFWIYSFPLPLGSCALHMYPHFLRTNFVSSVSIPPSRPFTNFPQSNHQVGNSSGPMQTTPAYSE